MSESNTIITGVMTIVVVAVLMMIVVPLLSGVQTSVGTIVTYNSTGGTGAIPSGAFQTAQSSVLNNTGSALNITGIIPMVVAASTIIAALLLGLYAVFFKKG
jgi:hypothetical protein